MKNYSSVIGKENSWILEMVNSENTRLYELIRYADFSVWAWISWACDPCYLSTDFPNYGFAPLPHHHATQEFLRLLFSFVFARLAFSAHLHFLDFLHQALFFSFWLTLPPSQKKFICPPVSICSLEISCLSRVEDKTRAKGDLAGGHQSLQRSVPEFTPAHPRVLSERVSKFRASGCLTARTGHQVCSGACLRAEEPQIHTPATPGPHG